MKVRKRGNSVVKNKNKQLCNNKKKVSFYYMMVYECHGSFYSFFQHSFLDCVDALFSLFNPRINELLDKWWRSILCWKKNYFSFHNRYKGELTFYITFIYYVCVVYIKNTFFSNLFVSSITRSNKQKMKKFMTQFKCKQIFRQLDQNFLFFSFSFNCFIISSR